MTYPKYFKRRQFILGPEYIMVEGWRRYNIDGAYFLTVHPDLPVYQVKQGNKSLTLLGYMVDPFAPGHDEIDILSDMLTRLRGLPDTIKELERQSGRFILLVNLENDFWLFHDAVGLRQVLFCRDKDGRTWCASQADSLAEHFGYALDSDVIEYGEDPIFQGARTEFWLANTRTAYREIQQLLPNHYIDLNKSEAKRFWPAADSIPRRSVRDAITLSTPILKNSILAMSNKHDLKMGVTAGMDSRKTLAASRNVKDKIAYFTIEHNPSGSESVDVKVPRKLLPKLGLHHQIFRETGMDAEFKRLYETSVVLSRESKGRVAYTLFVNLGSDYTVLSSNTSEITQCNYWLPKAYLTGEGLAIITGLYHPLAIGDFEQWLRGARNACEAAGLNILALFHWEQKAGRWAAASFSEYDIVHESFTPYDNRLLNSCLLGVSERYRRDRMGYVGRRQIKSMWPEVLDEPINPGDCFSGRLKNFVRRELLHRFITPWIPLYEYLKFRKKRKQLKIR